MPVDVAEAMILIGQAFATALDNIWRGELGFMDEDTELSAAEHDEEVDLHEVMCSDCGEPMDQHPCAPKSGSGAAGTTITTVTTRSTGPRKAPSAHPQCPHCGGRVHWNSGAALVNFDCIYRQYLMAKGLISDPSARLPVLTAVTLKEVGDWAEVQEAKGGFEYGNMGGAGGATYSASRPKAVPRVKMTPEEKKEKARIARAAKKASISEVAAELDSVETPLEGSEEFETPDIEETPMPESSKSRKPGRPKVTVELETDQAPPVTLEAKRKARSDARQARIKAIQSR